MIGKWFESYDEAWDYFLKRTTALEDFWSQLPEGEPSILAGWLIEPPPDVKAAARDLLGVLADLEGVVAVPEHFLHVWIHGVAENPDPVRIRDLVEAANEAWADQRAFDVVFRRTNCFHDAAVVEAHTDGVPQLLKALNPDADLRVALPHMTVAYLRSPSPVFMREALRRFRTEEFGSFHAEDARLCLIPISRSTFLRPWQVTETIQLSPC